VGDRIGFEDRAEMTGMTGLICGSHVKSIIDAVACLGLLWSRCLSE
jgi:hypothetical protein